MSAFDPDADLSGDVAFRLVTASFVRLFWRHALLEQTIDWLLDHGYQVVRLDAFAWTREEDLHTAIARALEFPNYYGRNLDALNDCLSDVSAFEYGARRDAGGQLAQMPALVIVQLQGTREGVDNAWAGTGFPCPVRIGGWRAPIIGGSGVAAA
ncbi:barstar family protein [Nonomuraea sp. NPDC049784]|uniref:barstar family protein n=1 Tax=Nonomuraea sp. NPDC049784 TaxID=3154361 RepID=UPI0033F4D22A